jgi:hypothetical protein
VSTGKHDSLLLVHLLLLAIPFPPSSMTFLHHILGLLTLFATAMAKGRIDTHFHALPPPYIDALVANGGDPSGYPTPSWSIDAAVKAMDAINTNIGTYNTQHNPISLPAHTY